MAGPDKANIDLRDPLQGFDVKVTISSLYTPSGAGASAQQLVGAFTSLMFKIVNQTETYLPVNSRIPRHLDGEILVVWSLEQGLVDLNVIRNTFGSDFNNQFKIGRGALIPRAARFDIVWKANLAEADKTAANDTESEATLRLQGNTDLAKSNYKLNYCRVDTFSFGVTAGRHVVANAWQGTAQHISKT